MSSSLVAIFFLSTLFPLAAVATVPFGKIGSILARPPRLYERFAASRKGNSISSQLDFRGISQDPCTVRQIVSTGIFPRGGAINKDIEEDDEDDDYDDEEDMDDNDMSSSLDFSADDGFSESDFAEETTVDRLRAAWKGTPPLTKGYLSASAVATVYGYVFAKNEFPKILLLDWSKVLTRLQIWRPFTSFLNFGPLGLGYLMTAQFVWVYMSTLERLNHNRPYDFWIMILFGQLSMVIGYPVLKLRTSFLGHNLSTFLVYIWSRYHEGIEVNMFELFNTRAELLPWMFLAQTFLLEGEPPILDFLGIVFGHLYHHCKTIGLLRAPESLTKWYEESESASQIRELYKPISSDFDAA